jgi:excinuclease UvrABC nuclease subunit
LLKSLGSLAKIKKAKHAELAAVPGIGTDLAQKIWNFFHPEREE